MKKYIIVLVCLVFCNTHAQKSKPNFERVYVEAGFMQPLGNLSNKFEVSPSLGFWFRSRAVKNDFIDLGFNFFIPKQAPNVNFKYRDSILSYKSKHFAINIGARFAKVVPLSLESDNFNFEWNSGIGLVLNIYKAPEEIEFEGEENSGEILTTIFLSQGIKVNYKNVGLQCHYQWSPYGLFSKNLEKDYGSQSLMIGIVYRQ
jgi:hypothetical protein